MTRIIITLALALTLAACDEGAFEDRDRFAEGCIEAGHWFDEASRLCWQNFAVTIQDDWQLAMDECQRSKGDYQAWRLPDIDELISLIRGCVDGVNTFDLSPSTCELIPEGCVTTDTCYGPAWSNPDGCKGCSQCTGPGALEFYMDPELMAVPEPYHWSSSTSTEQADPIRVFAIDFARGSLGLLPKDTQDTYHPRLGVARCVRAEKDEAF
jgi:hypothetical protein